MAVLAALLILLAAILAIQAGSRPTPFEAFGLARNGVVTYASGGDIVTVNPETGVATTLVGGADDDGGPVFSHDGTKIAFVRTVAGEQTLFTIAADGGELLQLTRDPLDIASHAWSPDDSELAFTNGDLLVVAADGSGMRPLDLGRVGAQLARWRPPAGEQILFTDSGNIASLHLVGRDGTGLRPIRQADGGTVTDGVVGWTNDGTRLITIREGASEGEGRSRLHVLTVAADGLVTDDAVIGPPIVTGPFGVGLAPDGTRAIIAAAETVGGDSWRVGVVAIDGSASTVITGPTFAGSEYMFGWSPDGKLIVVDDAARGETWLLDPAGGDERLAPWHDPSDELLVWQRKAP
jgi:Tol biopolymer transport system component